METKHIIDILVSQIPLLIMSINNGQNISNFIPILIVPLILCLIEYYPKVIKYIFGGKIPKNYVNYIVGNNRDERDYNVRINFISDLSVFLNNFYPSSIRNGKIVDYYKIPSDPNIFYRCYQAIISPDHSYFSKFSFNEIQNGATILENIKKTGFIIPEHINIKKLLEHPIYLTFVNATEEVETRNRNGENNVTKLKKIYIKISAIDMQVARDFIYIVINYDTHQSENINNFKLTKTMIYGTAKHDYEQIETTVNVIKNYKNVFLSEENNKKIINTITQWDKNKFSNMEKGIPNKLGFFLIGVPGCGKSSLIYAIANERKAHIVSLCLQDFTNKTFLDAISEIENKIVVIEDIDAYEITHDRKKKLNDINNKKVNNEFSLISNAINEARLVNNNSNDVGIKTITSFNKEMTLDVLLEVLDGYNYLNNCIVILTTNCPEKIDPAVIRPGRIDHTITFGLADQYQFKNIFKYFVGIDYRSINKNFVFKENKFTTSYLINSIILPNKSNPKRILELLNNDDS